MVFTIALLTSSAIQIAPNSSSPVAATPPPPVRAPIIWTIPTPPPPPGQEIQILSPEETIMRAATAAPAGLAGYFGFRIEGAGREGPFLFVNSEADYRDQRNLSLALAPAVQAKLRERFGPDLTTALRGHHILVKGIARRVRINFTVGGRPSGKYYYQTQVRVLDPGQVVTIN